MPEKNRSAVNKTTLSNDDIRDFVLNRFDDVKQEGKIRNLINFHSINKYLIMAHSPMHLNYLGNIIAKQKALQLNEVYERYKTILKDVLEKEPTRKTHSNVLMKILGYFKDELSDKDKNDLLKTIFDYNNNLVEIDVPLLHLDELTRKFDKTYLVRQTYFLAYAKVVSPHRALNPTIQRVLE